MTMSTRHIIDLGKYHFRHQRGDMTIIGTWMRTEDGFAPCLAVLPSYREGHERVIPCIVPLSTAWMWSEYIGQGDPRHVARACHQFALALGMDAGNAITCMRIAALVRDHISDLLRIPPRPTHDREVAADAIITERATGRQVHKEISDVL